MKVHRFFINFQESSVVKIQDKEYINQIKNVLKLKPSERVVLIKNNCEFLFELEIVSKEFIQLKLLSKELKETKSRKTILYCAIIKKDNFEMLCQKTTECGVFKIVPIITERTVKKDINLQRIEKILKEASEQSGRMNIPILSKPISFEKAIKEASQNDLNLFFDFNGKKDFEIKNNINSIGLFIGPEGGFTENENTLANGFEKIQLKDNILRAETAAIIATYLYS